MNESSRIEMDTYNLRPPLDCPGLICGSSFPLQLLVQVLEGSRNGSSGFSATLGEDRDGVAPCWLWPLPSCYEHLESEPEPRCLSFSSKKENKSMKYLIRPGHTYAVVLV